MTDKLLQFFKDNKIVGHTFYLDEMLTLKGVDFLRLESCSFVATDKFVGKYLVTVQCDFDEKEIYIECLDASLANGGAGVQTGIYMCRSLAGDEKTTLYIPCNARPVSFDL